MKLAVYRCRLSSRNNITL